jgi:hypothetical protein
VRELPTPLSPLIHKVICAFFGSCGNFHMLAL